MKKNVTILGNPLPIKGKGNPYVELLYEGLRREGMEFLPNTPSNVLKSRSIYHVNWPDQILYADSLLVSMGLAVKFWTKLCIAKLRGSKVVWTVHNLMPHDRHLPGWWINFYYRVWRLLVDGKVFLTRNGIVDYEAVHGSVGSHVVIPHGHYCDVYSRLSPTTNLKGFFGIEDGHQVIGHYGLIRDYKNVPGLIRAFREIRGDKYRLIIAGKVLEGDEDLGDEINRLSEDDSRVCFREGFLSESEMLELYNLTDLAVLPYSDIFNSGSAILALSLGCPILVTKNASMRELQDTFDQKYVRLIGDEGLASDIKKSIGGPEKLERCPRGAMAPLDWDSLSVRLKQYFEKLMSN